MSQPPEHWGSRPASVVYSPTFDVGTKDLNLDFHICTSALYTTSPPQPHKMCFKIHTCICECIEKKTQIYLLLHRSLDLEGEKPALIYPEVI